MTEFYNYIKQYLIDKFTADTDIALTVKVHDTQPSGYTPKASEPEIQMDFIDNYENTRTTTFYQGETSSVMPMQFTAWVGQMKIGGKTCTKQETARIFGKKLKKYLGEFKTNPFLNKNIIGVRHTTTTPPLPFQGGEKIYTVAVRYEFVILNPYKTGLENN